MEPHNAQNEPAIACPACGSDHRQIKYGKNATGKQQYQCHACNRRYVQDPQSNALDLSLRKQAVRLHLEGNNFRRTARLLGVNHQTVINSLRVQEASQSPRPAEALRCAARLFQCAYNRPQWLKRVPGLCDCLPLVRQTLLGHIR